MRKKIKEEMDLGGWVRVKERKALGDLWRP